MPLCCGSACISILKFFIIKVLETKKKLIYKKKNDGYSDVSYKTELSVILYNSLFMIKKIFEIIWHSACKILLADMMKNWRNQRMKKPNPEHVKKLCSIINTSPYPSLLSMKLVDIGVGYAAIEIDIQEKHRQLMGVVHGGMFASLIDTVAFWSVYYELNDPDAWLTSVDLKLNYLAPAKSGKLFAKGLQIKVGKKICYAEAEITNSNGDILTHGTSTLMILHKKELVEDLSFPRKFLD